MAAAEYVDMGTAAGTLKYARNKYPFRLQRAAAYRADSFQLPVNAVHTAADVHKAVFAPGNGGVHKGFNKVSFVQHRGAYRAGRGIAGSAGGAGGAAHFYEGTLPGSGFPLRADSRPLPDKQPIAEPQQENGDDNYCQQL